MSDPKNLEALRDAVVEAARVVRDKLPAHGCNDRELALDKALIALDNATKPPPVPTEPGAYYLADGRVAEAWVNDGRWYGPSGWVAAAAGDTVDSHQPRPVTDFTWATTPDGEVVRVPTLGEWKEVIAHSAFLSERYLQLTDQRDKAIRERDEARRERDELRAARYAYASEFPPDMHGAPDVGSIHENIRKLKAKVEQAWSDTYVSDLVGKQAELEGAHAQLSNAGIPTVADGAVLSAASRVELLWGQRDEARRQRERRREEADEALAKLRKVRELFDSLRRLSTTAFEWRDGLQAILDNE